MNLLASARRRAEEAMDIDWSCLSREQCFIVPRAFSLQGGSYDTRSKDFQLQVSYRETESSGADDPPVVPKLWHIFVSHVRSIVVKQGNLTVQV